MSHEEQRPILPQLELPKGGGTIKILWGNVIKFLASPDMRPHSKQASPLNVHSNQTQQS